MHVRNLLHDYHSSNLPNKFSINIIRYYDDSSLYFDRDDGNDHFTIYAILLLLLGW